MTAAAAGRVPVEAVVIGCSAGGVEALSLLLAAFRRSQQVVVFVVLHLPRERPNVLVDIYQPRCQLRIAEGQDKEPVTPGTVYFAPPDYHLLVDRDRGHDRGLDRARDRRGRVQLALSTDDLVNFSRPSIDVLFETAADVYRERLMGVVLTGGNHDGAAGLAAVAAAGGLTVVEDPASAQAPYMPEAALRRVQPDHCVGLAGIATLLAELR